jgi:hypothetical protein
MIKIYENYGNRRISSSSLSRKDHECLGCSQLLLRAMLVRRFERNEEWNASSSATSRLVDEDHIAASRSSMDRRRLVVDAHERSGSSSV